MESAMPRAPLGTPTGPLIPPGGPIPFAPTRGQPAPPPVASSSSPPPPRSGVRFERLLSASLRPGTRLGRSRPEHSASSPHPLPPSPMILRLLAPAGAVSRGRHLPARDPAARARPHGRAGRRGLPAARPRPLPSPRRSAAASRDSPPPKIQVRTRGSRVSRVARVGLWVCERRNSPKRWSEGGGGS